MKKRKGFTIVELAIVFVVVGIVMAMALKARNLVNGARILKEGQRIANLENAYFKYVAENGHEYRKTSGVQIDMSVFSDYITDLDRAGVFKNTAIWTLEWCKEEPGSDNKSWAVTADDGQQICVVLRDGGSVGSIPLNVACAIDIQRDDRTFETGQGRAWKNTIPPTQAQGILTGCDHLPKVEMAYLWFATGKRVQ